MIIRTDIVVYIWMIPLVVFTVLPLCLLAVYLVGRFIRFMLFPQRMRRQKVHCSISERDMEKAL